MRTGLCRFLLLKQKNYVLRFFPTPFLRELWIDKEYQHTANIFFSDYLQFDDAVIDIGANVGTVTLESAVRVSSKGRVYSIEPNKKIFKCNQAGELLKDKQGNLTKSKYDNI